MWEGLAPDYGMSVNTCMTDTPPSGASRTAPPTKDYSALQSARQLSSMRLEKPHSLSYQASTFSSLPLDLVWLASKIDDSGLWLKSLETSGRVL